MSRQKKRKTASLAKKGKGVVPSSSGSIRTPPSLSGDMAAALAEAIGHHSAGCLDEAERLYRRIQKQAPDNPDVLHLLGYVAHQKGDSRRAVTLIRKSLTRQPDGIEATNNLGLALCSLGRLDEAEESFRKALALSPDLADLHNNLGSVLQEKGALEEAESCVRRALELKPDFAEAWSNLGGILQETKRNREAAEACGQAVELNPYLPEAHNNLGLAFLALKEWRKAEKHFNKAIGLKPDYAEAFNNLASLFSHSGRLDDAESCLRRALECRHDYAVAYARLGNILKYRGNLDEAETVVRRAIELKPEDDEAHNSLGGILLVQGRGDEAAKAFRRAIACKSDSVHAHSNLILTLHYLPGTTQEEIFKEIRRWNTQHAVSQAEFIRPHANVPDPERRLKIGYVSADMKQHPVGFFFLPVISNVDKKRFEIFCYANMKSEDDFTNKIRAHADHWRDISFITDEEVTEKVRADGIDILIELTGHAADHRLVMFARKPAPVQVQGGGHYCTSGLDVMDYILSDATETPEGEDQWFSETVVRMPDGYVCYGPPDYAPDVTFLPALGKGYVTFGCCNNLAKINSQVMLLWADILKAVPDSRLSLRTDTLDDEATAQLVYDRFQGLGISPERITLAGKAPHKAFLGHYREIDMALDPFPYSGGLTTCEALWMGVPVISMAGETFAGRHSASHLHNVGLDDWVVQTAGDYLSLAKKHSRDLEKLSRLRASLRERMIKSPLCDGVRYTRNLEAVYRRMWRGWCNTVS